MAHALSHLGTPTMILDGGRDRETPVVTSVRATRRSIGNLGRAVVISATALAAIPGVPLARNFLASRGSVPMDATRSAVLRSLGGRVIPGAPREAYVLENVPANASPVRLRGREDTFFSIRPEDFVDDFTVAIGGRHYRIQKVRVGNRDFWYLRERDNLALCLAASPAQVEADAVAALDEYAGGQGKRRGDEEVELAAR